MSASSETNSSGISISLQDKQVRIILFYDSITEVERKGACPTYVLCSELEECFFSTEGCAVR